MQAMEITNQTSDAVNPFLEALQQSGEQVEEAQAPAQPQGDTATISEQARALFGVQSLSSGTSDQPLAVNVSEFDTPTANGSGTIRVAAREEDGSAGAGDTASFSSDALDALAEQISPVDKMTSSQVVATLDDGGETSTIVAFNNKTGAVTWNGNTLNLSGFANTLKDDVVIKNNNGMIDVYNLTTGKKMTLNADGTKQMLDGKADPAAIVDDSSESASLSTALFINNRGKAASAGDANDIMINRQAYASIDAGGGDDKIFNFAATAMYLDGGGGNDSVYSVGLTSNATIDVSVNGNGYVKLLGNMKGGSILLGSEQNFVDASGYTLSGVSISDTAGAKASAVIAKQIIGRSDITLGAAQAAVDTQLLQSSSVAFGSGANSLVASKVTGTATNKVIITGSGVNTYKLGAVTHANISSADAKSDAIKITGAVSNSRFDLSGGKNLLDATGQKLSSVSITSQDGANTATDIRAASIVGKNATDPASILLAGSDAGNSISVTGAITNAVIDTGDGTGSVTAGSVSSVELTMGGDSSAKDQNLTIKGKASKLTYTGAKGNDAVIIRGSVSNSSIELGEGDNSFTAQSKTGVGYAVTNTNISATGTGTNTLAMGNYTYSAQGNSILLGSGANSITLGKISGKGTSGLRIDIDDTDKTQNLTINGSASRLTYLGGRGEDNVNVSGAISNANIDLGEGNNTLIARNAKGAAQSVTNTNIRAEGNGTNRLEMGSFTYGSNGNSILLGGGQNDVTLGKISGKGSAGLEIIVDGDASTVTNLDITGSAKYLRYTGTAGKDNITVAGSVSASDFELGDGVNSFIAMNSKNVLQGVSNTDIRSSGQSATTIALGKYTTGGAGNSISLGSGTNNVTLGSLSAAKNRQMDISVAGDDTTDTTLVLKGATNYLNYTGTAGKDTILASGKISNSNIDLDAGEGNVTAANAAGVFQAVSNTNITASGEGSTVIGLGKYTAGSAGNSITLGKGDNVVSLGTVTKSKGSPGLTVDAQSSLSQTLAVSGSASSLTYLGGEGADKVLVSGSVSASSFDLGAGDNSFIADTAKTTVTDTTITASGSGANTVTITTLTGSKKVGSEITLGDGNDSVTINTLKGYSSVDMGLGSENSFTSTSITGTTITAGGGGSYSVGTAKNTTFNFTGAAEDLSLNIITSLTGATVDLGEGDLTITATDKDGKVTGSLTSSKINAGGGNVTMEVSNVTSSKINMNPAGADSSGALDMTVKGTLKNSTVDLGLGDNSIDATTITSSSLNKEGAGTLNLTGGKVSGTIVNLSGQGSDTIDIKGDFNAALTLGEGADSINIGGAMSGTLDASEDNTVLNAGSLSGLKANFTGENTTINVAQSIKGGDIAMGGGTNTIRQSGLEEGDELTLSLGNTTLRSAGNLGLEAVGMDGSRIIMGSEGTAELNLKLLEALKSSTVQLGAGDSTITASEINGGSITREGTGSLNLDAQNINGGTITLGQGSDTIRAAGDISSQITLGDGDDVVSAGGTLAGSLSAMGKLDLTANALDGATLTLGGESGRLDIASDIQNSTLNLGESDVEMVNAVNYLDTHITGGDKDRTINASSYEGGSIKLGNGNNTLNITDKLGTEIELGTGVNSIGTSATDLSGLSFTGTGSNTIRGTNLTDATISMGAAGKTNELLVSGALTNSKINLTGGTNTVGGADAALNNTTITGTGAGVNTILASSMTGGKITMGESDDHVDIYGNIKNATISLGEGNNLVRNTLTADQAGHTGQGAALDNRVQNSTIKADGNTNMYLGDVRDASKITVTETGNININRLTDSSLDASRTEEGTYIGVNRADTSSIVAGNRGSINVNEMDMSTIVDDRGRNTITIGTLGDGSSVTTADSVSSTSIHVNSLDGELVLGNAAYGGARKDYITITDPAYAGSVNIAGEKTDNAGTTAPAQDTGAFGKGTGIPV